MVNEDIPAGELRITVRPKSGAGLFYALGWYSKDGILTSITGHGSTRQSAVERLFAALADREIKN